MKEKQDVKSIIQNNYELDYERLIESQEYKEAGEIQKAEFRMALGLRYSLGLNH